MLLTSKEQLIGSTDSWGDLPSLTSIYINHIRCPSDDKTVNNRVNNHPNGDTIQTSHPNSLERGGGAWSIYEDLPI